MSIWQDMLMLISEQPSSTTSQCLYESSRLVWMDERPGCYVETWSSGLDRIVNATVVDIDSYLDLTGHLRRHLRLASTHYADINLDEWLSQNVIRDLVGLYAKRVLQDLVGPVWLSFWRCSSPH